MYHQNYVDVHYSAMGLLQALNFNYNPKFYVQLQWHYVTYKTSLYNNLRIPLIIDEIRRLATLYNHRQKHFLRRPNQSTKSNEKTQETKAV